jgi:signal transduction histidine kinase
MIFFILFITIGLFLILNYQIEKQVLNDQIRQRALLMGKALQLNLSRLLLKTDRTDLASLSRDEREEIREYIQNFSEEEIPFDIYRVSLGFHDLFFIDTNGKVIIDYPKRNEGRILPPEESIEPATLAKLKRNEIDTRIRQRSKHSVLLMTFPLFNGERLLGFGRIEMSLNPAMAFLKRSMIWDLIAAGCLFLFGILIATYFAKSVTRPIGELVQASTRIGQGDFKQHLDESRKDEIGVLMRAFNRMASGILELKETQNRVKKLEVASQLGARVAHEIKNPLNSIGLIIDHLRDRFAPVKPVEREKFLELSDNMKREVERLNKIVEGFLRSAKPSSLYRQPTDLNNLIDETVASITPEAEQQGVKIHRHYDQRLPKIAVDYHQVRQALLNLIINALQAMPDGGEIHISTAMRNDEDREVMISIRDTGHGIPPENISRLFDPYFTTKERGFGLGLSIVERIVQDHRGRIEVNSQIGNGSVFTLLFPIKNGNGPCTAS